MSDRAAPPDASTGPLAARIQAHSLDAELAALLVALVARHVPIVVAGPDRAERTELLAAISGAANSPADRVELADPEDADTRSTARRFLRAAVEGMPAAAAIDATSLEDVFERLEAVPIAFSPDERASIGLVLVLDEAGRVVIAHWVRPSSRDGHGHVQRLGPAVLAAWDARIGRWEDFAWGVMPELAIRLGVRAGDLEVDVEARRDAIRTSLGRPD